MVQDYSISIKRSGEKLRPCKSCKQCKTPHIAISCHPAWYVDRLSRERYGTDVPTLFREAERLKSTIRSQERDLDDNQRRYRKIRHYYRVLYEAYERVVAMLYQERESCRCHCVVTPLEGEKKTKKRKKGDEKDGAVKKKA